jgi:hypothetical protein
MNTFPSIQKFQQLVELKDYRPKTKKEYVRYVRRLADQVQRDPATLSPAAKGRWQRIQTLLDWKPAELKPPPPRPPWLCPRCGEAMQLIGHLARAPPRHA